MLYPLAAEGEPYPPTKHPNLSETYGRWFDVVPANTPELREKAYRLRYQVYCCEHRYETPDDCAQRLETDVFDCRSVHSLIIDRASGSVTGTVRLILPDPAFPGSSFPIQQICNHPLHEKVSMTGAAEISRFAISKQCRKTGDRQRPRELKCSAILGLMRAIVQMSREYCVLDWLAAMEPSLLRLLSRFCIHFDPIGPMVEYHGLRQPCHANVDSLLGKLRIENHGLWAFLTEPGAFRAGQKPILCFFQDDSA